MKILNSLFNKLGKTMATKTIKFDLQMKGVKVTSFDELQDNFSADILPIFQTGRLAKWLMSRELVAQAESIAAIDKNSTELQQLVAICRVLELDDDEEILQFLLDDRQVAQTVSAAVSTPVADASDVETDDASTLSPSGVDWSGQDMSTRQFVGENLRNANLKGTSFRNADLSQADLTGADLRGADLGGVKLVGANLTDANLTGADLNCAMIEKSNFKNANLTNAKLVQIRSYDFLGMDFMNSYFDLFKYKNKDSSGPANFNGANLTNANLYGAELVSDIFIGANLTGANFEAATLVCSDFTGADLTRANLHRAQLHNANFTKANLSFANMNGASFDLDDENYESLGEKANLTNAKLTGIIGFERPKIEPAVLPLGVDQEVAREAGRMLVKRW